MIAFFNGLEVNWEGHSTGAQQTLRMPMSGERKRRAFVGKTNFSSKRGHILVSGFSDFYFLFFF